MDPAHPRPLGRSMTESRQSDELPTGAAGAPAGSGSAADPGAHGPGSRSQTGKGAHPSTRRTSAPRRRRRWRSSQDAYDAGVRAGLLAAVDMLALLNDPGIITDLGKGFAANLREAAGLDPPEAE
jgi:hypothetical protein